MQKNISEHLDNMLLHLQNWNFPVCKLLNDPIDKDQISKMFQKIGLSPPEELIDLYQWRNGTDVKPGTVLDNIHIIPGYYFLSLEDAITCFLSFKDDDRWKPYWFPIFSNGGGDFYALDFSKANGRHAPVVGFLLGEPNQDTEYLSLASMLQTFSECYDKGIVFLTAEGYLVYRDGNYLTVAAP